MLNSIQKISLDNNNKERKNPIMQNNRRRKENCKGSYGNCNFRGGDFVKKQTIYYLLMAITITFIYSIILILTGATFTTAITRAILISLGGILIAFCIIKLFDICLKISEKYGDEEENHAN